VKPFSGGYGFDSKLGSSVGGGEMGPAWQGRSIAGPKLRMVEFSAFLEQQRDPDSVSTIKKYIKDWQRKIGFFFKELK
jgi:transcriptional enhancer factor